MLSDLSSMISLTTGPRICLRAFWPRAPRLKLTTILITVGFPVTISCIWSTFDLKKKESAMKYEVCVILSALDILLRIKQTVKEHQHPPERFVLKSQYSNKLWNRVKNSTGTSRQMRQETYSLWEFQCNLPVVISTTINTNATVHSSLEHNSKNT